MDHQKRKIYQVKQDDEDRRNFDSKWDRLNQKLTQSNPSFKATSRKLNYFYLSALPQRCAHQGLQRALC